MYNARFKESETFYFFEFSNGFTYDIPKETIKSKEQLNEWIMHLRTKLWFSKELEADLIDASVFSF